MRLDKNAGANEYVSITCLHCLLLSFSCSLRTKLTPKTTNSIDYERTGNQTLTSIDAMRHKTNLASSSKLV